MFGWKSESRKKSHRMVDVTGAYDGGAVGVMTGITVGTKVATATGWCDAGDVQAGDMVLTFDGGLQRVVKVTRNQLWTGMGRCPKAFWPLLVPAGAIENSEPMMVLPRQGVMLESDLAEAALGDPFALVPAAALEGVRGVERICPDDPIEVIGLSFESDQVIFAEHGALLFCSSSGDLVQMALQGKVQHCPYQMLPETCARDLVHGTDESEGSDSCQKALHAFACAFGSGQQAAA